MQCIYVICCVCGSRRVLTYKNYIYISQPLTPVDRERSRKTTGFIALVSIFALRSKQRASDMGAPEPAAASDIQLLIRTYILQYASSRQMDGLNERLLPRRMDRETMGTIFATINKIVDSRRERFWHMCEGMNLTLANVHSAFHNVVVNLFRDGTSWSRILTAVAYTHILSQYCRSIGLDEVAEALPDRLSAVLSHPTMSGWIGANGSVEGLRDFAERYDSNLQRLEEPPSAPLTAVTGFLAKSLNFSIKIAFGSNEMCS